MTPGHDQADSLPPSEAMQLAVEHYRAGRLAQAESACRRILLATPGHAEALRLHGEISQVLVAMTRNAIQAFQQALTPATLGALREARREMIAFLQVQSDASLAGLWSSPFREVYTQLLQSGLRDYTRDADETALQERLRSGLLAPHSESADSAGLLAAMLLSHSFELPVPDNLRATPAFLQETYVAFLLEMPAVHNRTGDADKYIDYQLRLGEVFHRTSITDHGIADDPAAGSLCFLYAVRANYIQAYFNTRNLCALYAQRGDIIAAALIAAGNKTLTVLPPRIDPPGKIRLGIFAGHFSPQTETFFTLSHFEYLDRSRFDITLYTERATGHPLEQHCIAHADRFVVLPQSDIASKVSRIRADDLDMLLIGTNMTAVTNTAALLGAFRLARIQIASVSSPVTTGCRHMDVMLSAQWNEPAADAAEHYTEHLYLMPGSINYYAYQYDKDPATISLRRVDLGIRDGQMVFFSGANFYKILPELSRLWVEILAAVPDSVLILMPFNPNWSNQYQTTPFIERIQHQMRDKGVDVNRLRVINSVPARADVHKVVALADVYLDAYPFSGACSMLDPILVGIPAVMRRGPVGRSNHAASLARMVGIEELVTDSEASYIATAVSLAGDPARRRRIHDRLQSLLADDPPPYFDIHQFSRRVGVALQDLYDSYQSHYRGLANLDAGALRDAVQGLANTVVGIQFELNTLTDTGIIHALIEPFFRAHRPRDRVPHAVDVGGCYGHMTIPFLAAGWTADLFEPDPGARQTMEKNLSPYASQCRVHAAAVSSAAADTVSFHKAASHGLSGLGDSPFGQTESIIEVPSVRLADFYQRQGIAAVDFLKIDAEGYDFDALESHDFSVLQPRLILIEYGTHFPRQTLATVNQAIARMSAAGYGAITFNYTDDGNFQHGKWTYRLIDLFIDRPIPGERTAAFGNIIFYRADDREFLLTLYALLENSRQPRREVWQRR